MVHVLQNSKHQKNGMPPSTFFKLLVSFGNLLKCFIININTVTSTTVLSQIFKINEQKVSWLVCVLRLHAGIPPFHSVMLISWTQEIRPPLMARWFKGHDKINTVPTLVPFPVTSFNVPKGGAGKGVHWPKKRQTKTNKNKRQCCRWDFPKKY